MELEGFNNLTRTLTMSFYYLDSAAHENTRQNFVRHLHSMFSAHFLEKLLHAVSQIIGATVLFSSHKTYEPLGASATVMVAENDAGKSPHATKQQKEETSLSLLRQTLELQHLDKSHLAAHTYSDVHPKCQETTFRVDFDISTCGDVSPLHALEKLFGDLDPDVWSLDLRIRGFTRMQDGKHVFVDMENYDISKALSHSVRKRYLLRETILRSHRTFMLRGMRRDFSLPSLFLRTSFVNAVPVINEDRTLAIKTALSREGEMIFSAHHI